MRVEGVNTLRLYNREQPVNIVWGNSSCLFRESYGTHKYTVWAECRDFMYKNSVRTSQETHYFSATKAIRLMLCGEIIAVYCENHTEHINTLCGQNAENPVRTSQETHYVSATETNRLMLFGETIAVYCETIWNTQMHCVGRTQVLYKNPVCTSQETNHVSATKTNQLMLFGETIAVYCENHTEHTDICKLSSYLTGNTLRLHYKAQPVNAVWRNTRCLL
jgi:hypothetical protein